MNTYIVANDSLLAPLSVMALKIVLCVTLALLLLILVMLIQLLSFHLMLSKIHLMLVVCIYKHLSNGL